VPSTLASERLPALKSDRRTLPERVRDELARELHAGDHVPGERLPNEDDLAARFGVSRATVREAVRALVDAGYLVRRHGAGTFVTAGSRLRHTLNANVSYTAMIRGAGLVPGGRILQEISRPATAQEALVLGTAPDATLFAVDRIRTAGERPVVYSSDRIPTVIVGRASVGPGESSLYELLERHGHRVATALAQLRPVVARARLARLLAVRLGTPLQQIEQVDFDELGRPVMLSSEWHVADVFELRVSRRNEEPDSPPLSRR